MISHHQSSQRLKWFNSLEVEIRKVLHLAQTSVSSEGYYDKVRPIIWPDVNVDISSAISSLLHHCLHYLHPPPVRMQTCLSAFSAEEGFSSASSSIPFLTSVSFLGSLSS